MLLLVNTACFVLVTAHNNNNNKYIYLTYIKYIYIYNKYINKITMHTVPTGGIRCLS